MSLANEVGDNQETSECLGNQNARGHRPEPGDIPSERHPYFLDLAAESALEIWAGEKDLTARQEALLDEAVEETFPASDPIAPMRILGRVHPERHEQRHAASV